MEKPRRTHVHGWSVAPGTAIGKPDLTSGGLGLAVKSGDVPCARPAHVAADRGVGRGTAMQKPDLTSCGHGHEVSGSGPRGVEARSRRLREGRLAVVLVQRSRRRVFARFLLLATQFATQFLSGGRRASGR